MLFAKKTDVVIILIILVISGLSWWGYQHFLAEKPGKAEIYYYSKLVMTVDLDTGDERRFSPPEDEQVVFHLYKDGSIAFESSDCPDQVCVHAGRIKTAGQFAACLPKGFVMKVVPAGEHSEGDADIVVGR
ncbi:NusG domain II-containing protein [Aminipila butyrica]|uniref:NusG domain II-containing protein n=1 Tax=Aminipila butyrica TaxID=433296 RepID=A0A858BVF8_9FIRM|nr:NusG domain II-containing protein [Aminipila butyrica]QIB70041.1 NusG domain II-containing protein [Aminipila butyrica]